MGADEISPEMAAARAKLAAKFNKGSVRTGGAGTVRRTKKAPHKATNTDDKKVQKELLKKYNCNQIQGIEEVHLFKDNGEVIRFIDNPKVQASIQSNFYAVSGNAETKKLQELLPGIISHLGNDSIANLKKIAESMGGAAGADGDDEEIPDLVEDFDQAE
jgi:nascent polypeptide-associated complex subunit beta